MATKITRALCELCYPNTPKQPGIPSYSEVVEQYGKTCILLFGFGVMYVCLDCLKAKVREFEEALEEWEEA